MRKFLLAIAVLAGLALGLPGGTANAAPARVTPHGGGFTYTICFTEYVNPPGILVLRCFTIQVPALEAGLGPGVCPQCGLGVELGYDPADLKNQSTVVADLGQGYGLLGQAAVSVDGAGAKLHESAVNAFIAAARTLGSTKLSARQVGYVDPATGKLDPEPSPWRQQAATELTSAISLLQSNILKPNSRTLAAATADLDTGYKILAENAACATG
jgi:hypothetical protein